MGCFNGQCIASKMNLFSGDKMVVFPLYLENKSRYRSNFTKSFTDKQGKTFDLTLTKVEPWTHGTGNVYSLGIPFFAQYNDYGGFEITKQQEKQLGIKILIETIKNYGITIDNKTCKMDHLDDVEAFDPKKLPTQVSAALKLIHEKFWRQWLYVKKDISGMQAVHFCYMSKEVYDYIMKQKDKEMAKFDKDISDYLETLPEFYSAEENYFNSINSGKNKEVMTKYFDLRRKQEDALQFLRGGEYFSCFHKKHDELSAKNYISKEKKKLNRLLDENEHDYFWEDKKRAEIQELLTSVSHLFLVNSFMGNVLNISWETVKTTGQEYSNKDIFKFQEFAVKLMKKKEKRFEE